jgi:uncharacterized protein YjbI with pentapeptide repeats
LKKLVTRKAASLVFWFDVLIYGVGMEVNGKAIEPGVDLSCSSLPHANLSGADLSGANLSGANLTDANLERADLTGANGAGAWGYANLTGATLPDGSIHE